MDGVSMKSYLAGSNVDRNNNQFTPGALQGLADQINDSERTIPITRDTEFGGDENHGHIGYVCNAIVDVKGSLIVEGAIDKEFLGKFLSPLVVMLETECQTDGTTVVKKVKPVNLFVCDRHADEEATPIEGGK